MIRIKSQTNCNVSNLNTQNYLEYLKADYWSLFVI